jgi:phosphatidylethanolamine/phosphatidyl-N-methylethanolamine N-methyltransferase
VEKGPAARSVKARRQPHESKLSAEFSHLYEQIFAPLLEKRIHTVITSLHIPPGANVLEVGIGTGLSMAAYPSHCQVVGIDVAADMLAKAQEKAAAKGWHHFRLREMDALKLTFAENAFDYVCSFHVLSVVPDPGRMMQEIHRVCKPGGSVVLINHFRSTTPVIGRLVGAVTPLTRYLGWDSSLRLSEAFAGVPIRIERCWKTSPFSLFTVVVGCKPIPQGGHARELQH